MGTIIVGYDGSDAAKRALAKAMTLDGELAVVSAARIDRMAGGFVHGGSVDVVEREQVKEVLAEAQKIVADAGAHARFIEVHGDPADSMVEQAKELSAELIVVGTHGKSVARRALMGSVSSDVVHHAPCDVLVVR